MKKLLIPLLLLLFGANAAATDFPDVINTNVSGLIIKYLGCSPGAYYGRWVNKNETSLEDRTISIESFDDDGNTIGTCGGKAIRKMHAKIQSTFSIQCNCRYSKTVKFTVSEPVDSGNIKVEI